MRSPSLEYNCFHILRRLLIATISFLFIGLNSVSAFEVSLGNVKAKPMTFQRSVNDSTMRIINISPDSSRTTDNGIVISWISEQDYSSASTDKRLAELSLLSTRFVADDKQLINNWRVVGNHQRFVNLLNTQALKPDGQDAQISIYSLGRPGFFAPGLKQAGTRRYQNNWYISEFGSYLEIVSLSSSFYDAVVVVVTYQGMGKSLRDALFNATTTDVEIKLHTESSFNASSTVNLYSYSHMDLRNELNDKYAARVGPPLAKPDNSVYGLIMPADFVHKSNAALSSLAAIF